jgi:hypothetical protein
LKSTCTQSPFVESNNIFSPCLSPSPKIYPTILITAAVRAYDTLALYLNKYKHYNLLIIKASQMKEVSQMEWGWRMWSVHEMTLPTCRVFAKNIRMSFSQPATIECQEIDNKWKLMSYRFIIKKGYKHTRHLEFYWHLVQNWGNEGIYFHLFLYCDFTETCIYYMLYVPDNNYNYMYQWWN